MKNIAIIDDDEIYQLFLKKELDQFYPEYNIIVYKDGESAIAGIDENTIISIIDYNLGDMNGIDVLKGIKENYPDVEAIMISGTYTDKIEAECYRNDAIGFIHKGRKFAKNEFFMLKKTMDLIVYTDKVVTKTFNKLEQRIIELENQLSKRKR